MSRKPASPAPARKNLAAKHLLWLIPLAALGFIVLLVATLPKFVASDYHRATIEGLASSLTGRTVHIDGKLSLALLPNPQFIADDVTITGPDQETITAASLTLAIAPLPLLRGQILARSLTLQSPQVALPWPLPGGAAAIAPPRWLAALHAVISNGRISLGAVTFTHVSADIFTSAGGAFSVSGNGELFGCPMTLSLGLGALSAAGSSPVTLDFHTDGAIKLQAHIDGTYDSSSTLSGGLRFGAPSLAALDPDLSAPVSGAADITADPDRVLLAGLNLRQGAARLAGSATLALVQPLLSLQLTGQNLVLPLNAGLANMAGAAFSRLPTQLTLDAAGSRFTGGGVSVAVAHLRAAVDLGAAGAKISTLEASLPGNASFWLSGLVDGAGQIHAKAVFISPRITSFLAAYGASTALALTGEEVNLAASLDGTAENLRFGDLSGNVGPARITGTAVLLRHRRLNGALHFDQLDLTPLAAMLRNPPLGSTGLTADFEITADRASLGKTPLQHLLIDAELGNRLVVRRLTARLFGGFAATSLTLAPDPQDAGHNPPQNGPVSSATAVLALPSAQPVAALLPASWQPPSAITRAPLALSFMASGPADALATSASLTLGAISVTAAPSINFIQQSAAGAFTLRHPDAIAAFKAFGLNAGPAWPGAGSIALRANMLLSPTQIGFSDFVLSMGALTGNGRLIYSMDHHLNGQIDADTLALPPLSGNVTLPWAAISNLRGKIGLSADQVLWGGNPILGPATASLTLSPNRLDLSLLQASIADGVLKGEFSATLPAAAAPAAAPGSAAAKPASAAPPAKPAPPMVAAKLTLSGADASIFAMPVGFPLTLPAGRFDAAIDLTATGDAPDSWLATLAGSASLVAHSGRLAGFDLPGIAAALGAKQSRFLRLRTACLTGNTPFNSISVAGGFSNGVYTLTGATLQGGSGSASASGSVDLADSGLALKATLLPALPAPPRIGLSIAGSWAAPRKAMVLKQALAWHPPARRGQADDRDGDKNNGR